MPSFNIVKQIKIKESFRVKSIIDRFDLSSKNYTEKFEGDLNLPDDWNVGVIYGASGTGKTTIAKQLFPEAYFSSPKYESSSIVDDFPKNVNIDELVSTFISVGFASPPSWLKPYDVLSMGEKMRVDIASSILNNNDLIVFDEFSSVVDRQVAKVSSIAIQKAIRKKEKKFIAVSCHEDIIEYLQPDWVFNTNEMTFYPYVKKNFTSKVIYTKSMQACGQYLGNITT